MPRWGPAKPTTRIKVIECGRGHWDETDHRLDIPHGIDTIDFKVTGTGHERIERIFDQACRDCQIGVSSSRLEASSGQEGHGARSTELVVLQR